jgi:hypothetical protein
MIAIGAAIATVFACVLAALLVAVLWCDQQEWRSATSPSGSVVARIEYEDCGAAGAPGYTIITVESKWVSRLLPHTVPWRVQSSEVLVVEGYQKDNVSIEWDTSDVLIVFYDTDVESRIVSQHTSWDAIQIDFRLEISPQP